MVGTFLHVQFDDYMLCSLTYTFLLLILILFINLDFNSEKCYFRNIYTLDISDNSLKFKYSTYLVKIILNIFLRLDDLLKLKINSIVNKLQEIPGFYTL